MEIGESCVTKAVMLGGRMVLTFLGIYRPLSSTMIMCTDRIAARTQSFNMLYGSAGMAGLRAISEFV